MSLFDTSVAGKCVCQKWEPPHYVFLFNVHLLELCWLTRLLPNHPMIIQEHPKFQTFCSHLPSFHSPAIFQSFSSHFPIIFFHFPVFFQVFFQVPHFSKFPSLRRWLPCIWRPPLGTSMASERSSTPRRRCAEAHLSPSGNDFNWNPHISFLFFLKENQLKIKWLFFNWNSYWNLMNLIVCFAGD